MALDRDPSKLQPAKPDDLAFAIAFALQFDGRRHHHRADAMMAQIVAEHVIRHLKDSGFVVMKMPPKPEGPAPDTSFQGR